jgi:hypothetical protein
MKCAVEMGSVAMIYSYIPSFIKIVSGIQKLMVGGDSQSQTAWRSHKPHLGKIQNKKLPLMLLLRLNKGGGTRVTHGYMMNVYRKLAGELK